MFKLSFPCSCCYKYIYFAKIKDFIIIRVWLKFLTRVDSTFLLALSYINYEQLFSYYCIQYCGHNVDAGFNMIMLYTILIFKIAKKATLTRQILIHRCWKQQLFCHQTVVATVVASAQLWWIKIRYLSTTKVSRSYGE